MGPIDDFSGKARSLTRRAYKKMASAIESEETKESVAKLKESISEVGKQLKESGKAISSQLEHGSRDSSKDSSSSPQPTASDDAPPSPPSDVTETEAQPVSKSPKKAKPKNSPHHSRRIGMPPFGRHRPRRPNVLRNHGRHRI